MTKTIKVAKFHRGIDDGYGPFITVDDYKAFLGEKRVGFVRVTAYHTEDMEGRTFTEVLTEEKQLDNEEAKIVIYQSMGS